MKYLKAYDTDAEKNASISELSRPYLVYVRETEEVDSLHIYDSKIEYLASTGTQYIILPLVAVSNDFLQLDIDFYMVFTTGGKRLVGCENQFVISTYSSTTLASTVGTISQSGGIGINTGRSKIMLSTTQKKYANGNIISQNRPLTGSISNVQLFGSVGNTNRQPMRIYSAKWTLRNNVIYDLIPVRVGSVGYMYDKISHKLFANSGSGEFTLGPDKS